MAIPLLTKPTTAPSGVVLKAGGDIETQGTDAKFFIALDSSDWDFWTPVEEVTGDGSVAPVWDNSEFLYCRFVLRGWMMSGKTVGILNMKDQKTTRWTMGLFFGSGESFPSEASTGDVQEVIIEHIRIHHRVRALNVGLVIIGYTTDTALTDIL